MTDWASLEGAYGSAEDIPELLGRLAPDLDPPTKSEAWDDLWGRLCHQGTVYSASFAALPVLEDLAGRWPAAARIDPLMLAGAIVSSDDVEGDRDALIAPHAETIRRLNDLAVRTLIEATLDRLGAIYIAQAALALGAIPVWGRRLDGLADGELQGSCPACERELSLVIGEHGFFVSADDWVGDPAAKRTPIRPAANDELPEVGRWLRERMMGAGQAGLAASITYLFGHAECPDCGRGLRVHEAVEKGIP